MRLVQLDEDTVVDAHQVLALVEHHYEQPKPAWKVFVYVHGSDRCFIVSGRLTEVVDKLRNNLAVGE
jgi:hypothetical protein